MNSLDKTKQIELFAWLGENEFGNNEVGLKQGYCNAGLIPMVAVNRAKMERFRPDFEAQAATYGKRIRLCRFTFTEVLIETERGE